ncbi:MAG: hypothetical protein E7636_01135 [Ruminococcaceae bacterium]|nr:hypothetical protein [Oscillospiraceae bacterium]
MHQGTTQTLFALLRSAIFGTCLWAKEKEQLVPEQLSEMIKLSKTHDIAHLLAHGLKKNNLLDKSNSQLEAEIFRVVYRYEQLNYELKKLCQALEKAQIPFLPLKGSVLRKYYPEAWMRTSCDIDVLVHEEDLQQAQDLLVNEYGYTYHGTGSHDISLYSPGKVHVELHHNLVEDGLAKGAYEVLKNVWDSAAPREGSAFEYEMPDEMFYFYHIAHMAKHFENGGCGIRPFIDVWVLNHCVPFDNYKREQLLSHGDLLVFATQVKLLSEIWFGEEQHTEITKQMEEYILRGGLYGTIENHITVQQQKKGSRLKYLLFKIFLPYDEIKLHYPILKKHRWLTPIMEVRRWFKLVFCGHLKRTVKEIKYNSALSKDEADRTKALLKNIGL